MALADLLDMDVNLSKNKVFTKNGPLVLCNLLLLQIFSFIFSNLIVMSYLYTPFDRSSPPNIKKLHPLFWIVFISFILLMMCIFSHIFLNGQESMKNLSGYIEKKKRNYALTLFMDENSILFDERIKLYFEGKGDTLLSSLNVKTEEDKQAFFSSYTFKDLKQMKNAKRLTLCIAFSSSMILLELIIGLVLISKVSKKHQPYFKGLLPPISDELV
jgi:hypothetical protein